MYLNSEALAARIREITKRAADITNNEVIFEEHIGLPYYGNIVLRFDLRRTGYTTADLDRYETLLNGIVREEFLVDFMGSVYREVGVEYVDFDSLLRKAAEQYKEEHITGSVYEKPLREDAEQLLTLCGLDPHAPVWEIQPEEAPLLLILSQEPGEPKRYTINGREITVLEADQACCEGLMKAVFYARRKQCSLVSALLACNTEKGA